MKKNFAFVLMAAAMMLACNNQSPKMDAQPAEAGETSGQGLRIAYIEVDSVMTQFEFAKEKSQELEKKSNNARNTLTQKGNQLQAAANNFQQKLQNNGFTSREQAENAQQALQRDQNNLAALQARLENELASEQQKFLQAFQDSLDHFLTDYNKDKKFDMIINKAAILMAGDRFDITEEVVNGMNLRYKKGSEAAADSTQTN